MAIIITPVYIKDGGNFVYNNKMTLGSSNNKPVEIVVDGTQKINVLNDKVVLKEPLSLPLGTSVPASNVEVYPGSLFKRTGGGAANYVLAEPDNWLSVKVEIAPNNFVDAYIPAYQDFI